MRTLSSFTSYGENLSSWNHQEFCHWFLLDWKSGAVEKTIEHIWHKCSKWLNLSLSRALIERRHCTPFICSCSFFLLKFSLLQVYTGFNIRGSIWVKKHQIWGSWLLTLSYAACPQPSWFCLARGSVWFGLVLFSWEEWPLWCFWNRLGYVMRVKAKCTQKGLQEHSQKRLISEAHHKPHLIQCLFRISM